MMLGYLASATLSVGLLAGSPQQLHWEASYGKALHESRESGEPLLVVLDNEGSQPVEAKLLGSSAANGEGRELFRPYRLCHVDVNTEYGQKVAKAFRATSFPHVAIIDKTGSKVIFRQAGQIRAEEMEQVLVEHRRGDGPVRRAIKRITNRPVDSMMNGGYMSRPSCPNCQRGF